MIVGHMTETYLTGTRVHGQPWEITAHRVVTQLHATKGWRQLSHDRRRFTQEGRISPRAWREADTRTFKSVNPRPNQYGLKPLQVRP